MVPSYRMLSWSWFKKDGDQSEIVSSNFCEIKIYLVGRAQAHLKKKKKYKHAERLAFLCKVQEVRMTTSNTAAPPQSPSDIPEVVVIEHHDEEEGGGTKHQQTVSSDIRYKLSQRHFSKKTRDSAYRENLLVEAMEKIEDLCARKFLHVD